MKKNMFLFGCVIIAGVLFSKSSHQIDGYTNINDDNFYLTDSSENGKGQSDKSPFRKRAHQRRKKIRPPIIGK